MLKLNLGCGSKILDGYKNIDKFDYYKPDIVHDLELTPYPFEKNSVDNLILMDIFHHLEFPALAIKEIERVGKKR